MRKLSLGEFIDNMPKGLQMAGGRQEAWPLGLCLMLGRTLVHKPPTCAAVLDLSQIMSSVFKTVTREGYLWQSLGILQNHRSDKSLGVFIIL